MTIQELMTKKENIQKYCKNEEFKKALDEIDSILIYSPYASFFLLLKAQILQLLDEEKSHNYGKLEDVKQLLKNVICIDESSVVAKLELVYFLNNVEDNKEEAMRELTKAIETCQKQLDECFKLKNEIESQ